MSKNKHTAFGIVMLSLTALIWGVAFVAQSVGMENVGAFTFNGVRTLLGAAVLFPYILIREKRICRRLTPTERLSRRAQDKRMLLPGLLLGAVFCIAGNLQQFAFCDPNASSGKIAFITALYIFFVPLLGIFFRKKTPVLTWICVACGFIGLYFLCVTPGNLRGISFGDILAFLCSIFFAVQILLVERLTTHFDGIKLSFCQLIVSGVLAVILMFVFEAPRIADILNAALPILYAGVLSCGLAYTFQIVGQKYTEATVASLIMCLESVFGVLAGALLLQERLSLREGVGCIIMFAAIVCSQLAQSKATKKQS